MPNWNPTPFIQLHRALASDAPIAGQLDPLRSDLLALLKVAPQSAASRKTLESKEIKTSSATHKLNDDFVAVAIELSSSLSIDEVSAAEILIAALKFKAEHGLAVSLHDAAIIMYYKRAEAIVLTACQLAHLDARYGAGALFTESTAKTFVKDSLVALYARIDSELQAICAQVRDARLLRPEVRALAAFCDAIAFRRNCLFSLHQHLGALIHALFTHRKLGAANNDAFCAILDRLGQLDPRDIMAVHYLPGLLQYVRVITEEDDSQSITDLKKRFSQISAVELGKTPLKATVIMLFYAFMGGWIDSSREEELAPAQIEFTKLVRAGSLEQLMVCASAISEKELSVFYDLRALFQKHIPDLAAFRLWDVDEDRTRQLRESGALKSEVYEPSPLVLHYSENFKYIFHESVDAFISALTTYFPTVVVRLCDAEEDFYLTNAKGLMTVDDLAEGADIERLYILMYFNFLNRDSVGSRWAQPDADERSLAFADFLTWAAAKTTNTLIKLSFLQMLASVKAKSAVYDFLNVEGGKTRVTWSTILGHITDISARYANNHRRFVAKFQSSYNRFFVPGKLAEPAKTELAVTKEDDVLMEDLELAEEELIELLSYFILLSSICEDDDVRKAFSSRTDVVLLDALFDLLYKITDVASIKLNFSSHGIALSASADKAHLQDECLIIGMVFKVLTALVPKGNDYEAILTREQIWTKWDSWIFQNKMSGMGSHSKAPSFRTFFDCIFMEFTDVLGFLSLFEALITPSTSSSYFVGNDVGGHLLPLPYPRNLGQSYRKTGVWPYYDYLLNDVFVNLTDERFDSEKKNALLAIILNIVVASLRYFDPRLIVHLQAAGVDSEKLDKISGGSFSRYVLENPATAATNYILGVKSHNVLLDSIAIGQDRIADKPRNSLEVQVVSRSLEVLRRTLEFETHYREILLPILRNVAREARSTFLPNDFSSGTLITALLSRLSVVAHLGLYVRLNVESISTSAIYVLAKCASLHAFGSSHLATVLETTDEARRIRLAFVSQFGAPRSDARALLVVRMRILEFIVKNLERSDGIAPAHILLGFLRARFDGLCIGLKNDTGSIALGTSLLGALLRMLERYLAQYKEPYAVGYNGGCFASAVMNIVVLLCEQPLTSEITFQYLESFGLYTKLLKYEPILDLATTSFPRVPFDDDFSAQRENDFLFGTHGAGALACFFSSRAHILRFMQLHLSAQSGDSKESLLKFNEEISLLVLSDGLGASKLMAYLDILEFNIRFFPEPNQKAIPHFNGIIEKVPFAKLEDKFTIESDDFLSAFDTSDLEYVLNLSLKRQTVEGKYLSENEKEQRLQKQAEEKKALENAKPTPLITGASVGPLLRSTSTGTLLGGSLSVALTTENNTTSVVPHTNPDREPDSAEKVIAEENFCKRYLVALLAAHILKTNQIKCVHAWAQLAQSVVQNPQFNSHETRVEFVLVVLESILPRIDVYYEYDARIAKEFMSLARVLFDAYVESVGILTKGADTDLTPLYERLLPLLRTCFCGITDARADSVFKGHAYALVHCYLSWVCDDERGRVAFAERLAQATRGLREQLVTAVCADARDSGTENRVAALGVLEALCRLGSLRNKSNSILRQVTSGDFIATLVAALLSTDALLRSTLDTRGMSLAALLYELTAFRSGASFLTRIAESPEGAAFLVQQRVFDAISGLHILSADPDLGLILPVGDGTSRVGLTNSMGGISLTGLLVPILQLIAALLVSAGASNAALVTNVRQMMDSRARLFVGILKRGVMMEDKKDEKSKDQHTADLSRLVDLVVLLSTLTGYNGGE